jgi:hypothetical protein
MAKMATAKSLPPKCQIFWRNQFFAIANFVVLMPVPNRQSYPKSYRQIF